LNYIPYGRQDINEADVQSVIEILRSDWLTQGPTVDRFEQTVSSYCGAAHAVAVNSATSALHIACLALGLGPGDRLWTSPNTFVASANCGLYCGANIDFVDIDPRTWNISIDALREKLASAERSGTLPKILIPVHFAGQSCDMASIRALADKYGFRIIEDASHAIGGSYRNTLVGSCKFSDITVFSFHPVKIITTGEGGMALTNDSALAERLRLLRSHGITRDADQMPTPPEGPWSYQQTTLGFNYRMTDIQAALGISQMARLDTYVACRQKLANRYTDALSSLPLILPWVSPDVISAFHLYPVLLDSRNTHHERKEIFNNLRRRKIGVNVHYMPVYLQPHYLQLGFAAGYCPEAERYYARTISLPLFATLNDKDHARVCSAIHETLA
jgi:UDP-4-amino-4,6-dideoxy-N-acetyl-beta-L-altrosamine transaminase